MENEGKKKKYKENTNNEIPDLETKMEKELVTLIATIVVEKILKNAREKGNSLFEIQP